MKRWFHFIPAEVIADRGGPYHHQSLAMWQWFVRRLHASQSRRPRNSYSRYEFINGTSSIHNTLPDPVTAKEGYWNECRRRVKDLLLHAGQHDDRGSFLRNWCGIGSWSALTRPVRVPIATHQEFPDPTWLDMAGRRFKGRPNPCHRKARWLIGSQLILSNDGLQWALDLRYGYPHDSSEWNWRIWQEKMEPIPSFVQRANAEIANKLISDPDPRIRNYQERQWQNAHRSLSDLFYDNLDSNLIGWEDGIADVLSKGSSAGIYAHRIRLTAARLATLRRWAKERI